MIPDNYDIKFAEFLKAVAHAKQKSARMVVAHPAVLGDTYDEVLYSLGRLAEAGVELHIISASVGSL